MNALATLPPRERGQIFIEAGARLGFAPFHVEKDFWVCWTNLMASITHQDPMFREVMAHRSDFVPYGWIDHLKILPGDLLLVPPADRISAWMADFAKMKSMFFGVPPSFEQVLKTLQDIQNSLGRA